MKLVSEQGKVRIALFCCIDWCDDRSSVGFIISSWIDVPWELVCVWEAKSFLFDSERKKWRRGSKSNKNKKEKHLTTHKHNEKPGNYVFASWYWVLGTRKNWYGPFLLSGISKKPHLPICLHTFTRPHHYHYHHQQQPLLIQKITPTKANMWRINKRKTIFPLYFGGLGGWLDWLYFLLHSKPIIVVSVEGFFF